MPSTTHAERWRSAFICSTSPACAVPVLQHYVAAAYTPCDTALLRWTFNYVRSNVMNTVIYIVGLIVVVGFLLSFFGLR